MPKKSERKVKEKSEKNPKIESKKLSDDEYKNKVFELAQKNLTSEKIGEKLRHEGIHPKEHKLKISKILKEKNMYNSPDLINITNKVEKIKLHAEKNKQDKRAQRELVRITAQLRKLKEYHKII